MDSQITYRQESQDKNEQEETTSAMSDDFFVDKAVFVGDSRIHGFSTYGYIPSDKVFALDGSNQKTILESEFVEFENCLIFYLFIIPHVKYFDRLLLIAFNVSCRA